MLKCYKCFDYVDWRFCHFRGLLKTNQHPAMLQFQIVVIYVLHCLFSAIKQRSPSRRYRYAGRVRKKGRTVEELIGSKGNRAQGNCNTSLLIEPGSQKTLWQWLNGTSHSSRVKVDFCRGWGGMIKSSMLHVGSNEINWKKETFFVVMLFDIKTEACGSRDGRNESIQDLRVNPGKPGFSA